MSVLPPNPGADPSASGFGVDSGAEPVTAPGESTPTWVPPPSDFSPEAFAACMARKRLPLPKEKYFKDALTTTTTIVKFIVDVNALVELAPEEAALRLGKLAFYKLFDGKKVLDAKDAIDDLADAARYAREYVDCCKRAGMPESQLIRMHESLGSISADVLRNPPGDVIPEPAPAASSSSDGTATALKLVAAVGVAVFVTGVIIQHSGSNQSAGGPSNLPAGFPTIPAGTYDLSACVGVGADSYNADNCTNQGVASGAASAIAQTIANTNLCTDLPGARSCSEKYTSFNGSEFDVVFDATTCTSGDCGGVSMVLRVQKAP